MNIYSNRLVFLIAICLKNCHFNNAEKFCTNCTFGNVCTSNNYDSSQKPFGKTIVQVGIRFGSCTHELYIAESEFVD